MMRATQTVNETVGREEEGTTMEGDAILEEIHRAHDESIPKATQAAYAGPIRDYRAFCLEWAVEKEGKLPLDQVDEAQRSLEEMRRYGKTSAMPAFHIAPCASC